MRSTYFSGLKEMLPCIHLIFYTITLFMKLEDPLGQVMVKREIYNIISVPKMISDQISCVNLNAYEDVIFNPTWDRNMYLQHRIDAENCQI